MALTQDDKSEILKLVASGYSRRKIADKRGHSETTIRDVIRKAEAQILNLRAEGLDDERIATELACPISFVTRVTVEPESASGKEASTGAEVSPTAERADIGAAWDEFRRLQDIESAKAEIRKSVNESVDKLVELEIELEDMHLVDTTWRKRKRRLANAPDSFVAKHIDAVDSMKELATLENVAKEIEEQVDALVQEYRPKIEEAKGLGLQRKKKRSDQLLDKQINIPRFPSFVKKKIRSFFVVETEEQATSIADAMHRWADMNLKAGTESREHEGKVWRAFWASVKERGWEFVRKLAKDYREESEGFLLSIGICPRCDAKLTRKHAAGEVVLRCPSCGASFGTLSSRDASQTS